MREVNAFDYGHIDKNGKIHLELSEHGDTWLYKSVEAFEKKEGICYAIAMGEEDGYNEDDIATFTYQNFLEECTGNEEVTQGCFEMTGEMNNYPGYYFEVLMEDDEVLQCECGYVYFPEQGNYCPKCGSHKLIDDRMIEEVKELESEE